MLPPTYSVTLEVLFRWSTTMEMEYALLGPTVAVVSLESWSPLAPLAQNLSMPL